LTLRAFSPNWTEGAIFKQTFYNPPPFYRAWWFVFFVSLGGIIIALFTAFLIIKRFRKKDKDKLRVQQNLLMLEQMALQGQMNPHFIFNCIAALRYYYASGNTEKADKFIEHFSMLIRQTFEMGTAIFIPLEKELGYLTQYLNVEQMRFNDSFSYHIRKEMDDLGTNIVVPAMLLQPIVENAVRHGIRHLPDNVGEITLSVIQKNDLVTFVITDNGIGRKRSAQLKSQTSLPALTSTIVNEKRIHILNKVFNGKIIMEIEDTYTDGRPDCGTRVTISFPVNLKELQHNESSYS
jgi:sensor histidine kinase YesM